MTKAHILTVADIESFTARLKATVEAAHESQSLLTALSRLVKGGAPTEVLKLPSTATPAAVKAAPARGGKRAKAPVVAKPATGRRRGRAPRVEDRQILELLRRSAGGMTMNDLQSALGQHVETIRLKLRNLRQSNQVKTTGPRNQLRYHSAAMDVAAPAAAPAAVAAAPKKRGRKPGVKAAVAAKAPAKAPAKAAAKVVTAQAAHAAPAVKGRRGRAAVPAPDGLMDRLAGILRGAGASGVQMSTFEAETKQPAKTIRKVLESMRVAHQVTVSGQRRSTRYHVSA